LDWAATLRKESLRSSILRSDELARRYGIAEGAVGNALRRQERRGLVEHVSRRVYVNKLAHRLFSARTRRHPAAECVHFSGIGACGVGEFRHKAPLL